MRPLILLLMTTLTFAATGCGTVIKQTYYGITGATGSYYELNVVDASELASYRSFTTAPFDNALGDHVPPAVMIQIDQQVPAYLRQSALYSPDGRKIRITGTVMHFTGETGLDGAISTILGGQTCVCRVKLLDDETGELIGEAMCWAEIKSVARQDVKEFGIGVGRGIVKWLEDRLGEQRVKARRAEFKGGGG